MKLDFTKPYGTIYGHDEARYEQDGHLFRANGEPVTPPPPSPSPAGDMVIETDAVDSAKTFLTNVLKNGPLSKSAIFKIAGENNQEWKAVSDAADSLNITRFSYKNATMWKLPEEA